MKNSNNIKQLLLLVTIAISMMGAFTSCEDFLNRPDKSSYTLPDFYQNDEQCLQAVNFLYSAPWADFYRGWLRVGDCQSGNYYMGSSGFWKLTPLDGSVDGELDDMSASLWAVNGRANTILENIDQNAGPGTTEAGRNKAKGETLVWKALAYFYMVRIYGAVPIVHNSSEMIGNLSFNELYRAKVENVYDYIILTLEQAIEWLPETNASGRIDKYSAYGLLAKVYLTKSGYGRNGDRNQADLDKAKEYADKVIKESGRSLEPEYADIFRGSHNETRESLISWHWVVAGDNYWTAFNMMQPDLTAQGFDEFRGWGSWGGPSLDLQTAFGEDATKLSYRINVDKRRKATMMMYGDVYPYFWRDHPTKEDANKQPVAFPNGFDYTKFYRDVLGGFHSSTGANCVKHIVGNNADHTAEIGHPMRDMGTSLATHLLRLADIYLIYAEAALGNSASTSDAEALAAFNAIRKRAGVAERTSITFDDIFKERRLELAFEGDFWYDFVRLSYYKPDEALARLNAQNRKNYIGITDYYFNGVEGITVGDDDKETPRINTDEPTGQPYSIDKFVMPFPDTDLQINPHLREAPIEYDMSQYHYSF
ncbi:MAG: RagB/SusD family nutrient uptake outer membrane protein [Dysgonamonadaceae bacterium]|nr:RagB/SusD family nutrient uptake outer membrane protein [Dysgonamonadaceae bacterium]